MSGIYYDGVGAPSMVDAATAAGLVVVVPDVCVGWEHRARSSGGWPAPPLAVFVHHTASDTAPLNDLAWMIDGCDDAPVGNWLIDRAGVCYPIAAGASNCAGQGGPAGPFTRGTIPADQGNTRGWQIECASDGVGGPWPAVQVDALFGLVLVLNRLAGNAPTDVLTHALAEGTGWTDRKIDPARADAVLGDWWPDGITSADTWLVADIRAECARRALEDDDMTPEQAAQLAHIEQTTNGLWEGQVATNTTLWAGDESVIGRLARLEQMVRDLGAGAG